MGVAYRIAAFTPHTLTSGLILLPPCLPAVERSWIRPFSRTSETEVAWVTMGWRSTCSALL